jgi:hypothetical protein
VAMPKTGSRRIVVDGATYRWRIRRKLPTLLVDYGGPLVFSAELIGAKGSALVVSLPQVRGLVLGDLYDYDRTPATPGQVATAIRDAIAAGWRPSIPGKPFEFAAARTSGLD